MIKSNQLLKDIQVVVLIDLKKIKIVIIAIFCTQI